MSDGAAVPAALARRRGLTFAIVAGAVLLAVVVALLFADRITAKMPDLEVYWTAAARARAAEPLYRAADLHYQFKYLPAFAVMAIPLGLVSLPAAKVTWAAILLILLGAALALSAAALPARRRPVPVLIALTFVAMAKFYGHEIVLGQVNLLFAVLVLLALAAMRGQNEVRAGLLLVLAIVVKPYAVIFLPWLLARRRIPSILAAVAGIAVVVALPALWYGVSGDIALHIAWWRTVSESTAPNLTNADNVSIAGMYAKWLGAGPTAVALSAGTSALLLTVAALVFIRRAGVAVPDALEGGLLLTCIPLLSPQGWDYVFLVSTPAIMLLVNDLDRLPRLWRVVTTMAIAAIGLSLFDLMGRAAYAAFMRLSIISVCYLVVIAALAMLRLRRVA